MIIHARALAVALMSLTAGPLNRPRASDLVPPRTGQPSDTATSQFDVGSVRVILRRNTANDVVAANLYLLGGAQQLTPQLQGIEPLLLAAAERGTLRYPGDQSRRRMAQLGSTVEISASEDWTLFGFHAIRSTFDSTWAVFADRVMHPTLDPAQVELVRGQMLSDLRQSRAQPDEELQWQADSVLFQSRPYGLSPEGTEGSLAQLSVAMLRSYHTGQFVTSRMLLVIVGNVDRAAVEQNVRRTLTSLPRGHYTWRPPVPAESHPHGLYVQRAALPTNYVLGYYVGPPATSPDYDALRLASALLAGRLFSEIRSKRNLTYAVDAPFLGRAFAVGGVYVTAVAPDTVLRIMRAELDALRREAVAPSAMQRLVQQFITEYYLRNETNADQATLLARAALYDGDYRRASTFVERLLSVTPDDISRVARQYMRNFQFSYIGDPAKISAALTDQF